MSRRRLRGTPAEAGVLALRARCARGAVGAVGALRAVGGGATAGLLAGGATAGLLAGGAMVALLAFAAPSSAAPRATPVAPPLAPLPMLPSIARVRVEVLKTSVVVATEVLLPRGEWKGDSLDFWVAFGAPGVPRAVDAHLLAVPDGALEPREDDAGEALAVDRQPRRPPSAYGLLGRDTMAGHVVHVKREPLSRALAPGNMAALRIRSVLDMPEDDPSGGRSVVVRLGASRGTPLTLGRITIGAKGGAAAITRADARLCGPDADPSALAVGGVPRTEDPTGASRIAPVLSVRHVTDDLCLRFFTSP